MDDGMSCLDCGFPLCQCGLNEGMGYNRAVYDARTLHHLGYALNTDEDQIIAEYGSTVVILVIPVVVMPIKNE